jgi:hypothetical protein
MGIKILLAVLLQLVPSLIPTYGPECRTEDSVGCVWHAEQHGNHKGHSFWTEANGTVHYM